jgi:hypothetical protein
MAAPITSPEVFPAGIWLDYLFIRMRPSWTLAIASPYVTSLAVLE